VDEQLFHQRFDLLGGIFKHNANTDFTSFIATIASLLGDLDWFTPWAADGNVKSSFFTLT
jgi:hypothetical protein